MLLIVFASMLAVGGVSATWTYTEKRVDDIDNNFGVNIGEFEFKPEEILPDDEEADQAGQNHVTLLDRIVNHITYGLNSNSKPIVNDLLQSGTAVVYSQQNVQGGNLKHLLVSGATVDKLDFAIAYVSATEYACYTFSSAELTNSNIGTNILAYKTKIVKENGKWVETFSYEGKATVTSVNVKNSNIITINVNSWVKT